MFKDYYLSCESKKDWDDFISQFIGTKGLDISVVGSIVLCDPETLEELSRNDNYHVNVRINPSLYTKTESLEEALNESEKIKSLSLETPQRVWD